MQNLIVAKTFNTRLEAEITKGFLEASNIQSIISSDDEGGMSPYPMQPSNTGVKLLVHKDDYQKVNNLLKKNDTGK